MGFYAKQQTKEWCYLVEHISPQRNLYLMNLNDIEEGEITISLRDVETNGWSKWEGLFHNKFNLMEALDIHRSLLYNELVIESDYETFEENYSAARIVGAILEDKGFQPLYYYSGSKSIHIHVFLDFKCLKYIDSNLQEIIITSYTKNKFVKEFIQFLRIKAAKCWDVGARQSDEQVASSTRHLIRSELSLNKKGFKTFIGYTYKDLSWIPPIHNLQTKTYPKLGEIRLSTPTDIQNIVEEFLQSKEIADAKKKKVYKIKSLSNWLEGGPADATDIRPCVKLILEADSRLKSDGYNRAFFILFNELKRVYDDSRAQSLIEEWNMKMGTPIRQVDIEYRAKTSVYTLSCDYIHNFLATCGYSEQECNH